MGGYDGDDSDESDARLGRRAFVKRSAAASMGLGVGLAQEEPGLQTYQFVVEGGDLVETSYVNKFVITTELVGQRETTPFGGCFTQTEQRVANQFRQGAYEYEVLVVDATETLQIFGDGGAGGRLRRILDAESLDLPDALDEQVGGIDSARAFTPAAAEELPTTEAYRVIGGESCDGGYVRLEARELADEITAG